VVAGSLAVSNGQLWAADYDWDFLNSSRILIESIDDANGIPGVRATFVVQATRQEIWATLLDYNNFPGVFEGIDDMKVLDSDENGAHVEFWIDAVLRKLHYVLFRDYVEPGRRLTWKRVSGDMKDIHGSWQILDTADPDRKLVIYESFVDIGFAVVTWAIRLGAKRKAEDMANRFRGWIEHAGTD
jgi:carbon monoxide dehydrogenase subunit G